METSIDIKTYVKRKDQRSLEWELREYISYAAFPDLHKLLRVLQIG